MNCKPRKRTSTGFHLFCAVGALAPTLGWNLGCDRAAPPSPSATTTTTTAPATATTNPSTSAPQAAAQPAGPKQRISLIVVPFSAEVPAGWSVQRDVGERIVLHGNLPSGEFDILLTQMPDTTPELFALSVKKLQSTQGTPNLTATYVERDGMKVVSQIETQGTGAADTIPMRWTVQYVVPGQSLNLAIYEFNVIGLSKAMVDRDGSALQAFFDSVKKEDKTDAMIP